MQEKRSRNTPKEFRILERSVFSDRMVFVRQVRFVLYILFIFLFFNEFITLSLCNSPVEKLHSHPTVNYFLLFVLLLISMYLISSNILFFHTNIIKEHTKFNLIINMEKIKIIIIINVYRSTRRPRTCRTSSCPSTTRGLTPSSPRTRPSFPTASSTCGRGRTRAWNG